MPPLENLGMAVASRLLCWFWEAVVSRVPCWLWEAAGSGAESSSPEDWPSWAGGLFRAW
uniref:Secreted protein n=1 Tax=Arundo donax TaxID=35708 RepID=A0A0A9BUD1_ARUDO